MGKWCLSVVILILMLVSNVFGLGRYKRVNVDRSKDPMYAYMLNKKFRAKQDLLVYKFEGSGNIILGKFGIGGTPYRDEINKKFPFNYYEKTILGILPENSEFQIVRITEEGTMSATFIEYYLRLITPVDNEFTGKEMLPIRLMTVSDPPQLEAEFFEEIIVN